MKDFEQIQQDKPELEAVKPIRSENKLIGKLKIQKGHTCFQLDLATGIISTAKYESFLVFSTLSNASQKSVYQNKLQVQPNCIYCMALNQKNAIKHFAKMLAPTVTEEMNKEYAE